LVFHQGTKAAPMSRNKAWRLGKVSRSLNVRPSLSARHR
jgi:hypothetical protein